MYFLYLQLRGVQLLSEHILPLLVEGIHRSELISSQHGKVVDTISRAR